LDQRVEDRRVGGEHRHVRIVAVGGGADGFERGEALQATGVPLLQVLGGVQLVGRDVGLGDRLFDPPDLGVQVRARTATAGGHSGHRQRAFLLHLMDQARHVLGEFDLVHRLPELGSAVQVGFHPQAAEHQRGQRRDEQHGDQLGA